MVDFEQLNAGLGSIRDNWIGHMYSWRHTLFINKGTNSNTKATEIWSSYLSLPQKYCGTIKSILQYKSIIIWTTSLYEK